MYRDPRNDDDEDDDATLARRSLRWSVYAILIALSLGAMIGHIAAVNSVDKISQEKDRLDQAVKRFREQRQTQLAAQDLSAAALEAQLQADVAAQRPVLEEKLRLQRPFLSGNDRSRWCTLRALVEHGTYAIDDVIQEPGWDTIDMVKHPDRDGQPRLYSSKPPLYATWLAGQYWIIHKLTGATLGTHPYDIGRAMLIVNNVAPMAIFFWLLARLVERHGRTDWGRIFVMAAGTGATFLSTFAVVLNNHTPAAVCAMVTLYALSRIMCDGEHSAKYFLVAGTFAALTAANELPALAFFAAVTAGLLIFYLRPTLQFYLPAVVLVAAAYFGTNYIAHASWRIPYMHRSQTDPSDDWYRYTYERNGRTIESYWNNPGGIDRGEPSPGMYALHVLVGHHGIFSLTPVWLASIVGLGAWLALGDRQSRLLALLIAGVSAVCITFYLLRPLEDRNYGGMTSAFRWVFWLAPLWLWAMLPAADSLSTTRPRRLLAYALLALSVLSATYPTWNPWTLPWLHNLFAHLGWSELPR